MRTVTYGAACSLDGFIAKSDGSVDWLHMSPDVHAVMAAFWKTIDTLLWGRKTLAFAAAAGDRGGSFPGVTSYVFSRTLKQTAHADLRLVSDDAGAFVRDLKQKPGKGMCVMSGGDLARSLFAADVIDEVRLNVHPILLGSGVPLFRDAGRVFKLEFYESRVIDGGCLLVSYRVIH